MSDQITYLIIGNGIAGTTAAEILRAEDPDATIGMITDDPFPVYYRPALKDYLGGRVQEEKLWARSSSFYQDQRIFLLQDHVVGIKPDQHTIQLQSNKQVAYQKLLLANGAGAARLDCPGCDLEGVTTLRTIADYQAVLERLPTTKRVVVSGSGTLALETVETLRHRDVQVTHLLRRQTLWSEVLDATASDLVLQQERRDGVDLCLEEEISEIIGSRGAVTAVITNKGQRIACELVLVAIGIEPNIGFIRDSKIACWRGVRVDSSMRTNAPDIYAAGDIVEITDRSTNRTRVIGQWYPAIQQARAAAYSMLGILDRDQPFLTKNFYNATFLYGLDFASAGLTTLPTNAPAGFQELVAEPKARTYRKVLLKDGVAVGVLSIGDRKQALAFKRAIDHRVSLQPVVSQLFADDFHLHDWLDSQGVPPPLLGVKRTDTLASAPPSPSTGKQAVPKNNVSTQKYAAVHKETLKEPPREALKEALGDRQMRTDNAEEIDEKMVRSQPLTGPTEALLVHVVDASLRLRLPETQLSQSKVTTIGRQAGVHILIDEGTISRYHAEIRYLNGSYQLRDLGSSNGTFINGSRVDPAQTYPLQQNDEVLFGKKVRFRFLLRLLAPVEQNRLIDYAPAQPELATAQYSVPPSSERTLQVQTVLNPDGTLSPPGVATPVPVEIVAMLKDGPALVVLSERSSKDGKQTPQVFMLKAGKHTSIGREEGSDIQLTDVVVSRHHAEVFPGPAGFYIHDLGSSNGVTVNQARITSPYLLSHGDRIKMGGTTLFFVDLAAGQEKTEVFPKATRRENSTAKKNVEQPAPTALFTRAQTNEPKMNVVVCQRCGVVNTHVARFCAGCSAPLIPSP